jgi:hypothetical protein
MTALADEAAEGRLSQEPSTAAAREVENTRLKLKLLTLSNKAVWDREHAREEAGGAIRSPFVLRGPYLFLCGMIDVLFDGKPIERFWFLENVARMPYLSYVSMLHLYESLGWWRRGARVKQIHFAEEWNEFHHLLIMVGVRMSIGPLSLHHLHHRNHHHHHHHHLYRRHPSLLRIDIIPVYLFIVIPIVIIIISSIILIIFIMLSSSPTNSP